VAGNDPRAGNGSQAAGVPRNRRAAGFTLLEVVVAVSIFAVIGIIALTGLGKMTRDGQALAEANNRLSDLQFAVVYFDRDWAQVSPRGIRNQYGDSEANIVIADDTITFTRSGWSNLLGYRRSNLQRVQYLVDDERLLRRYWQSLDQGIGEQPVETVLLDRVESMEVALLNAVGSPLRSWPPEASDNDGQPILLSLKLELPDRGDIIRLLEVPDGAL
jgi:general secretion pathway protein J